MLALLPLECEGEKGKEEGREERKEVGGGGIIKYTTILMIRNVHPHPLTPPPPAQMCPLTHSLPHQLLLPGKCSHIHHGVLWDE